MTEREVKVINFIQAMAPPFIYSFIMIVVQVVIDMIVFVKNNHRVSAYANYASSYTYLDELNQNLQKYSYLVTLISACIAVVVFTFVYRRKTEYEKQGAFKKELTFWDGKLYGIMAVFGIAVSLGLGRLLSLFPLDGVVGSYEKTSRNILGGSVMIQILSVGIIVPIAEELIYRGLVYRELKKLTNERYGLVVSAVLFGLFHFNLLQGLYACLLGIVLASMYERYQTITIPILIHSVANISAVVVSTTGISAFFSRNMVIYLLVMMLEFGISYGCLKKIKIFTKKC